MCVLILFTRFVRIFLVLRRTQRDTIINVRRFSCKVPVILLRCHRNFNFLDTFSKNIQILNFIKIRPVEAKLFHAEGRTDEKTDRRDEANANAPKNDSKGRSTDSRKKTASYSLSLTVFSLLSLPPHD